ncbi:MAG: hypothetical protein JWM95_4662 [Gemmatimonadetes bacterium]|nr:hypothetical protein [Gemmatimonadota bacterium]
MLTSAVFQVGAQGAAPDAWVGKWKGSLATYGAADTLRLSVPVTLEITKESPIAYKWHTVYAADTTRGAKDYRMRVIDVAAGRYVTDESNGILIDAIFMGGALISVFQVGERMFENRITLVGDALVQDLIWWRTTSERTTTGSGGRAAEVQAFRIDGRQRTVVHRDSTARR